ncbi:MAG TPA: class I SAM-dependent methyltransferase [Candidatus Baltobacteraceae bacterium]|nr:class I SAM-dependent methyltransferase [Candidatus Baltobacteraceae bacterium]
MDGQGDFGNLIKSYEEGRQRFPEAIIEELWGTLALGGAKVLDLGCGTGISTRQLLKPGLSLFGLDKDQRMISTARAHGPSGIQYSVGTANRIPFPDGYFDAVTAFSSFHWFYNKEAVLEIKRALKDGGIFLVANKNHLPSSDNPLRAVYEGMLDSFFAKKPYDPKSDYDPAALMRDGGFKEIRSKSIMVRQVFTVRQAIAYVQSVSKWNLIEERDRERALETVTEYCNKVAKEGTITDEVEIAYFMGKR